MPAISLAERSEELVQELVRRGNFASREPGVILIFAILGALGIAGIGGLIYRARLRAGGGSKV